MSLKEDILKVMGGEHVAAIATAQEEGKPAVRFMALVGLGDLSLVGATMKGTRKVEQIKKNPEVALSIWSGKNYADPYVTILARPGFMTTRRRRRNSGTRSLNSISRRRRTLIMWLLRSLRGVSSTITT